MEGDAEGDAPQSKKRRAMLRVSTSVSNWEGDAADDTPQSKKKRVMLRVKHLSLKRGG